METAAARPLKLPEQERLFRITEIERGFWGREGMVLAGMDEVGRGPLAGPVVTACVVLPERPLIEYVNDSKKLSPKRRETLYEKILALSSGYATGWIDAAVIDEMNILQATKQAFAEAFYSLLYKPSDVLIDAMQDLPVTARQHSFVKGDERSYLIAAASIVAKVERDRYMEKMDALYPEYGFQKNKGYGTREHIDALKKYGPCPLHRRSFIKGILGTAAHGK